MSAFTSSNTNWDKILLSAPPPATAADQKIAVNQQLLIVRNSLANALITFVTSGMIVIYFLDKIDPRLLGAWFACMLGFSALSMNLWARLRNTPTPRTVSGRFIAKSEQVAALMGFAWSILVFGIEGADREAITFFVMLCAGKAAAFTSMSGQVPRLTARFSLGCILPVVTAACTTGHPHAIFMLVLSIAYIAMLQRGAIGSFVQLKSVLDEQVKAQQAQADLSNALETIHDAFAIHDADGGVALANSRFREWFPDGWQVNPAEDGREHRLPTGRWVMHSVSSRPAGGWVSVHRDISALKARERELVSARREAEEASAAKGRFLSTMSHELRTPLNIINGFSRLMARDSKVPLPEQTVRDYGDSIHEAGEHLLTVINDIIEFSKSGADTYLYDPKPVPPRELLASAVTLAAGFNRLQSLEGFSVSVSPMLGDLVVDEMAIRRVLINLIHNAVKFSGAPMSINLRAFLREDGCPVISVRDNGTGLSPEEVEQVFQPFYQCRRHMGGDFAGTGLGLTISRQLARLHDGDVLMRSREGAGTTVSLVLPAKAHVPAVVDALAPGQAQDRCDRSPDGDRPTAPHPQDDQSEPSVAAIPVATSQAASGTR